MAIDPTRQNHGSYVHDDQGAATKAMAGRTAADFAGFFLPLLRPGMSLLDCGCGPGSITIGLAQAVAPGAAVGLDFQASQVQAAAEAAVEQKVPNVRFVRGDVYRLPFDDASFDAVFANMLFEHLNAPVAALREMHRVLKGEGVIGIHSPDFSGRMIAPEVPLVEEALRLCVRYREHNGGDPCVGKKLRGYLLQAGFRRSEAAASLFVGGTAESTLRLAKWIVAQLSEPLMRQQVIEAGWADKAFFAEAERAAVELGKRPDAFLAFPGVKAIGWK